MIGTSAAEPLPGLSALRPGPGSTDRELEDALADVRSALSAGQTVGSLFRGAHRDLALGSAQKRDVAAGRLLGLDEAGVPFVAGSRDEAATQIVAVRTSPVAELDPLAPEWTRALKTRSTRGPFVNAFGENVWIDTFLLPRLVNLQVRTAFGRQRLIARMPIRGALTAGSRLKLTAGSLWLPARELVPGRTPEEFVGLRIGGGTVEITGTPSASGDTISVAGRWQIVFKLRLASPPSPQPTTGPGSDATNAKITLPNSLTLVFASGHPATVQLANAEATAWGSSIRFARTLRALGEALRICRGTFEHLVDRPIGCDQAVRLGAAGDGDVRTGSWRSGGRWVSLAGARRNSEGELGWARQAGRRAQGRPVACSRDAARVAIGQPGGGGSGAPSIRLPTRFHLGRAWKSPAPWARSSSI